MRRKNKKLSALGIFLILAAVVSFIVFYLSVLLANPSYHYVDTDTMELVQTQEIPEGAGTVIITTSLGEIRAVLYPEYAPETVAQFRRLVASGYYDGTSVFETKEDAYCIAGGRADGSLAEGGRIEQEHVPQELSQDLWTFRGALCAMTTEREGGFFKRLFGQQRIYTGTRFLMLGSVDFSDPAFVEEFRNATGSGGLAETFLTWGGVPHFAQQMTVFGQTYAGLDVVEAICGAEAVAETNAAGFTPPVEDIRIEKMELSTYGAEDAELNELTAIIEAIPEATEAATE